MFGKRALTEPARAGREPAGRRPPWTARLLARLRAAQYDRLVAVGVEPEAGSALAAHYLRLTSAAERDAVAGAFRRVLHDVRDAGAPVSFRAPLHASNVAAAEDVIERLTVRLHAPRPVCARGMARLRLVLADGAGPLYRVGRGDLRGRLGAALAEL
ncbi:hypothetical protein Mycch_2808 [Mycolicibacterium chubuense NBB4]|uniref:Uncharacterized protein n=1 Tax=Mycolicibacterium chubuense (strain NBB4) TaxID=710421 RepID=I4BJW2_MYCCN|nr:hypothetical protein [Mycolicibacterium chubuense]AFM17569.1 hypothetical protein Mycch_2808 [Mycolicibacterium chubuense NBB4]